MKKISIAKLVSVSLSALVIGGCSTTPPAPQNYGKRSVIDFPEAGAIAVAEVGQTIISKANLTKKPGIEINAPISDVPNPPGVTTVKSNKIPLSSVTEAGKYYQDNKATYTMLGAEVPSGERAGVFVPADKNKSPVIFHYTTSYGYGKNPVTDIKEIEIEEWSKDAFKRELIYTGVSQNTISLMYREFLNDTARPAFAQELKYDLSQGKEIGYKGARFEVLKANNIEIQYRVIKRLD